MAKSKKVGRGVKVKKTRASSDKKGSRPRDNTIKQIILTGISLKETNEDILSAVKAKFPDSKTQLRDVSWYKSEIKSGRMKSDGTRPTA